MSRFLSVFFVIGISFCLCSCTKMKASYWEINASLAINNGNYEKAEEFYKKVIALEPNVAEHHRSLATVYVSMKENNKVKKEIEILQKMGRKDLADQALFLLNQPLEE